MKKKVLEISNRLFYTIVLLFSFILAIGFMYALGTSDPSSFGHSPSEIGPGTFSGAATDIWVFPGKIKSVRGIDIGTIPVIDSTGNWIGSPTGLVGPQGPQG
ncbi:MAG: hypothetical protein ABIH28_03760, partial [archaeon]